MKTIKEIRDVVDNIRELSTKKAKETYIQTLPDEVRNFLGGHINMDGVGYKIAFKIETGPQSDELTRVIEAFDTASKLSGRKDKEHVMQNLVLTTKDKKFVMQTLYGKVAGIGKLMLGITIQQVITFDSRIKPMLAKAKSFDPSKMIIEHKFDGHRALLRKDNDGTVHITSRAGKVITNDLITLEAQNILPCGIVLDGEIISPEDNFEELDIRGDVRYKAFDILYLDGKSVMELPFTHRRDILEGEILNSEIIQTSSVLILNSMEEIDAWINKTGAEGIIAKDPDGVYEPGKRKFIKYKHFNDLNADIVGLTEGQGKREGLMGAIQVIPEGLTEVTKVGSGFTDKQLDEISDRIKNGESLRCVVKYQEITKYGSLRFPVFLRLI